MTQNPFQRILAQITPYLILALVLVVSIVMFFIFSYIFLTLLVVGLVLGGIGYLYAKLFQPKQKPTQQTQHKGRIIDQEKNS